MDEIDLCIVGPAGRDTGGVARYIAEQQQALPDRVASRVYDVATPPDAGLAASMLFALAAVVRFPFRDRPDVVHVHTSHYRSFYLSAAYVFLAATLWRRPVVTHVHGSSFDEFVATDSPALAGLQAAVFEASDRVVVLSEYWADALAHRVDERKLLVLPNAIDPDGYAPQFDVDPPHLAFVSNHIERKGIRELTTAVDALLDDGHDFEVTIAGSGPLSWLAEDLAAAHEQVTYAGYVSEETKRDLLSRASIYALPTYAEGLPIALLEGMAGGDAVVSTRAGSIPDVIGTENGELVTAGDVDELRGALKRLITDPDRTEAVGRRNRRLVEEHYSWDRAAERLTALYDVLCNDSTDGSSGGDNRPTCRIATDPADSTAD